MAAPHSSGVELRVTRRLPTSKSRVAWYVVALLTAVYALNIADRYVISTLIEPIKLDLGLSDSSIGLLTGVALAIFYVGAGLPLAVLADRTNRRTLIAVSLAAWSGMTAVCGLTHSFWQLLLARIGVGIGEAGGTPASHALISDYFPRQRRAFALSVYSVGASLGSMLGSSAGYASDAWGWRSAFLLLAIPGIALALLLRITVREPRRGALDPQVSLDLAPFTATLRHLIRSRALLHCLIGGTLYTFWAWGLMWWTPSYLVRSHHMNLGEAGGKLALMHGIGGTIVLLATSELMRRMGGRDPRAVPWFVAVAIGAGTLPSIVAYSSHNTSLTLAMLWLFIPLSYANFGPTFALVQNLCPPAMRAQGVAVLLFAANIANLILAPQLVGIASDLLASRFGAESLRIALLPLAFTGFWAATHYWLCGRHLRDDLPAHEPRS